MIPVLFFQRSISDSDIDVLRIVSECFAENRKAADVFGVRIHRKAELQAACACKIEFIYRHIRDLESVHEGSVFVNYNKLQESVLIPVGEPPVGSKDTLYISEISGARPGAKKSSV